MLLIFGPIIGIVALISLFSSGRPIFICQTRIGKNCDEFGMYKFRTFKTEDGKEQITRLGRFLRPLRLDELPQIINIIRGDMSLVGPRPELPSFHKLGMENIENYSLRLLVKPGLTGWAQINYKYTTTLEEYRIKTAFDLYYVKHRSFILDLKCLLKTPFAVFITLLKREG
jgi:lipopolysaccharide/colanic/teichoic acid biosynthesis glycosyltransferase